MTGATALLGLGAALGGLPGPLLVILAAGSSALGAFSLWWLFSAARLRRERGTVYVVRESARWQQDDAAGYRRYLRSLAQTFPAVRVVPGPGALRRWDWPLEEPVGVWSALVDELVMAIRVVGYEQDETIPGHHSLVVWARWPVAIALTARLAASERGRPWTVRQRPSFGRAGHVEKVPEAQRPLSFAGADATRRGAQTERRARAAAAALTWVYPPPRTIRLSFSSSTHESNPTPTIRGARVSVLVVRVTGEAWGPMPATHQVQPDQLNLPVEDFAGVGLRGAMRGSLHELRCSPAAPQRIHSWEAFEPIAHKIIDWVVARTAKRRRDGPEDVVLLGVAVPQEIALGMGLIISTLDAHRWPPHLYPLVWQGPHDRFVVPSLDLGWVSLTRGIGP